MVEPVNPLERRELDSVDASPRAALPNDLGLVEPNDRLSQGVVVGVADTADRWLDPDLGETLRVTDRKVLLGFKSSSQHWLKVPRIVARQAPRRASSRRGFSEVFC